MTDKPKHLQHITNRVLDGIRELEPDSLEIQATLLRDLIARLTAEACAKEIEASQREQR